MERIYKIKDYDIYLGHVSYVTPISRKTYEKSDHGEYYCFDIVAHGGSINIIESNKFSAEHVRNSFVKEWNEFLKR